jgi:hypothetical protein
MRKINIKQIEENIEAKRSQVNAENRSERGAYPRVRRARRRSADESEALTLIAKASVERAKREGKMKMTGKRKMYYDPSE